MSLQVEQIPPTVDDADDFDVLTDDAIKGDVLPDDQISQSGPDVVSRRPETGVLREAATPFVDAVEQGVGGVRVVCRDVVPEVN